MKTWIFQSTPDDFNIDEYIKFEVLFWTIRQEYFAPQMEIGDIAYIWKSKGKGGYDAEIIAKGELISKAGNYSDNRVEKLYTSEEKYQESRKFQRIKIKISSRGSIWRKDEILKDDILKKLKIVRFAQNTNYLLSDEEAKRLDILWSKNSN